MKTNPPHQKVSRLPSSALVAVIAGIAMNHSALATPPAEADVQGFYEGAGKSAAGEFKIEARVVAQGGGNYKVLVRQIAAADKITRVELSGKTTGDDVSISGQAGGSEWKAPYVAGVIKGSGGGGTFELKRVEKKSPTSGKAAPQGAVVLLDGKNFSEVTNVNSTAPGVAEDGSIQIPKGGMSTKRPFDGSFDLHVEFMNPLQPAAHSQGRGNSGVYLPNGDEIQVLDSFGETTYLGGGCGGLYHYKDPDAMELIESLRGNPESNFTLASYPPLTWQTYDIQYRVEKKDGKPTGKPRVTVLHNGQKIHDNAELHNDARVAALNFQDHGNPVRYRNIWLVPVE